MTNREAYERDCKELEQYRAIGTVEECREAREKQAHKDPQFDHMLGEVTARFYCPSCGYNFIHDCIIEEEFYCYNCGQALRINHVDENLEETEDE